MAKYIIELNPDCVEGEFLKIPVRVTGEFQWIKTKSSLTPYTEPDRKAIEDEVWGFASHLINVSPSVTEDIYWSMNGGKGIGVAAEMTYQEARAKYDAWKKERDEESQIRVGDEVRCMDRVGIVVRIDSMDGGSNVVWEDGATAYIGVKDLTKTNRHFDEVEKLLERMKAE